MLSSVQEIKCMRINMFKSIGEAIKYNWREKAPIMHTLYGHLIPHVVGMFAYQNQNFTKNKN